MTNVAETARRMWASGDYASFGDLFAAAGSELVRDVGVDGRDVLDVATVRWPSVQDAVEMLDTGCGPMVSVIAALKESGRWPEFRAKIEETLEAEGDPGGDGLAVDLPYLRTIVERSA